MGCCLAPASSRCPEPESADDEEAPDSAVEEAADRRELQQPPPLPKAKAADVAGATQADAEVAVAPGAPEAPSAASPFPPAREPPVEPHVEEVSFGNEACTPAPVSPALRELPTEPLRQDVNAGAEAATLPVEPLPEEVVFGAEEPDDALPSYVIAWGANDCGQCMLGQKAPERCVQPRPVKTLQKRLVRHVFAGYDYSCVVTGTERLYAAGCNRGRLLSEDDSYSGGATSSSGICLVDPQHVGFDELEASRFVAVSGGRDHLVAVTDAGAAISWGRSNEFGQLGHGRSGLQRVLPAVVAGLPAHYQVVAVACGEFSTLALVSSGELYAWGANDSGQLGAGDTEPRQEPTRLAGSASGVPFRAVSSGLKHSLALSRSGRVYAWGSSRHGRLGLGDPEVTGKCVPTPRMVEGLPFVKHISAGGSHSAVLAHSGKLLTAGDNRWGQLGISRSQTMQADLFQEVGGAAEGGVRLVECGSQHTLCLTLLGLVVGFGCNSEGQLGTGVTSECEDTPVQIPLEQGVGQRLLIYALAVTMDHSFVLAAPAPERREHLPRYLADGGRVLTTRPTAVTELGEVEEEEEYRGTEVSGSIPHTVGKELNGDHQEEAFVGRNAPLVRTHSYVKFRLPCKEQVPGEEEVVLLRPVVQPGVASREFAALSTADLLLLVRAAHTSGEWRDAGRSLAAVLRRPSVLNACFHFPSLQEPRLAAEQLHEALEMTASAPPAFRDGILEAAAKGLEEYCDPAAREGPRTRERLRGALTYLLLPQLRNASHPQAPRHKVLGQVAFLVASLSPCERKEVLGLLMDELPQAAIMRKAVVPAVQGFLNERIKATHSIVDPQLWNGAMLMQVLFLANERLCEQQLRELEGQGTSRAAMSHRFLRPSEFQIIALNEETIPPRMAYEQLVHVMKELGLAAESDISMLPQPAEMLFTRTWCFKENTQELPPAACALMVHRNLVPVAFKQKVLQVSNLVKQHSLQEQLLGPARILALLAGHDARTFFQLSVRRQHIVEDTVAKLRQVDAAGMRFPLRIRFEGEEGLDEGGVRREFFQVLIRQLFDEAYAMFVCNSDSRTVWFNMAALETPDTDAMYRVCGIVMGLAVYNNEDGIQIHFPLALFKKLKGEQCHLDDLEDVEPNIWLSMQKLLAWSPTTDDPNREFEDTFCLNFIATFDFFGETRTVELRPGGESMPVNFDNRSEYVDLYCKWLLDTSVERQFRQLAEGFGLVVDSALWSLLTAQEAHLVLCSEPELDFDDLRKGARYEGYGGGEAYISAFWEVLNSFDLSQRKRFLAFVTGCDRAPLGGLHELRLAIRKTGEEPIERLPTAHTCFKMLDLPQYSCQEKLCWKLLTAIDNSEGFGLE